MFGKANAVALSSLVENVRFVLLKLQTYNEEIPGNIMLNKNIAY
ncbi:hypothetical protein ALIPUT_01071 [Alistipes putredinis DSM 17216]|uniref:Uncharacterized protein n=1 Tax=Alistipes putredinis DSM 17216 TaxID=445970 RepID=B0MVC4_9BACT|nr:hypothetical protein ALIPUT_01071 [Alistipes putredinis DSM 17216]